MSQISMVPGQQDADVVMKENAAAAALVDVAAGFVKKASDSASSSSTPLPTNNASRKQWDREQAAPPTTDANTKRPSTAASGSQGATSTAPATTTAATATTVPTNATTTAPAPKYQPPVPPTPYHPPIADHRTAGAVPIPPQQQHHAQVPPPHAHAQVARRPHQPQQPPPPPPGTVARADSGRWPTAAPPHHQPPPPGYPPHHPHAAAHHAAVAHAAHHHAAHAHHAHVAAAAAAAHAHHQAAAAAHSRQQAAQQAQVQTQARPAVAPQPAAAVLMSMSSIGFGVAPASSTDATEAVIRAVQDSMERSAVRLPTAASLRQSLTIHLKLGVPPKKGSPNEPMNVDVSRLSLFLPQSVPLLPVEIVVGGLLIDHKEIEESTMKPSGGTATPSQQPTICTAVACVTLQQSAPEAMEKAQNRAALDTGLPSTVTVRTQHAGAVPWATGEQNPLPQAPAPVATGHYHQHQMPPLIGTQGGSAPNPPPVHRTNSMEVLAHVSGEIRERQMSASNGGIHDTSALAMVSEAASLEHADRFTSRSSFSSLEGSYSYKKLAPGMTPKNNKRLFVRHDYKDYSREPPLPEEQFLLRSDAKTPNAAFPLKLHETLSQIEEDGYAHIIGWMHHGRSFKIRQQQEFVDVVLPKYFVMTKKSSFLRQLNLYNFNRISVGPDSGSYYHEYFLKGLKFLAKRINRQKVNGNGIRAAGNPDDEPVLIDYPKCPPREGGSSSSASSVSQNESDNQDTDQKDNGERPYSRLVGGPPSAYSQTSRQTNEGGTATAVAKESTGTGDEAKDNNGGYYKKATTRVNRVDSSSSQASFPLKLHKILDHAEAEGKTNIISWLPHGRAFLVHDPDRFTAEIMPQHFNQTKYSSFQRQLHMYLFQRITYGRDKGGYYHDNFHKGRPDLCMTMVRTRVNGKGCRRPGDPDNEPDFYADWEPPEGSPGGESERQTETENQLEDVVAEPV